MKNIKTITAQIIVSCVFLLALSTSTQAAVDQRYMINQDDISPRIVLFTQHAGGNIKNVTASSTLVMKWVGINLSGSTIDINLVAVNSGTSTTLVASTTNDGQETVTFPANLASGDYKIRLRTASGVQATTWATYRVTAPKVYSLTILTPTASTSVMAGDRIFATWTSQNISRFAPVEVTLVKSTDENVVVRSYGTSILGNTSGSVSYVIPSNALAGQYKLKAVASLSNGTTVVASSSYFTVTRPTVATSTTATTTVAVPTFTFVNITASSTATAGRNMTVTWASTNVPNQNFTVVKLVNASSTEVATLYAGTLATQGTGIVKIPSNTPAGQYSLKWMATVRGVARTATSSAFRVNR